MLKNDIYITVLKVSMSLDLREAKIFVDLLYHRHQDEILAYLNLQRSNFNKFLLKNIKIKYLPELKFIYDKKKAIPSLSNITK